MRFDVGGRLFIASMLVGFLVVFALAVSLTKAHARDSGQWENSDPSVRQWYKSLMQPDAPAVSCCGEADAYWCDDIHIRDGKTYCKITDDRPDLPSGRVHRNVGDEFEIPPNKLKWDSGNPTGHAVIFLRVDGVVWCFVQPGGV